MSRSCGGKTEEVFQECLPLLTQQKACLEKWMFPQPELIAQIVDVLIKVGFELAEGGPR